MRLDDEGRRVPGVIAREAGRGDGAPAVSLGSVFEAFRVELTAAARREIGPDLAEEVSASDLVRETFRAAGRDIAHFRGAGPAELRGWLGGILRHLVAGARRRYREADTRRVGREADGGGTTAGMRGAFSAAASGPSERAVRREREHALRRGLMGLPEHYRLVIRWHHRERLSFDAIAARLGITPEATRMVWGRALVRLRDSLGPGHDPR